MSGPEHHDPLEPPPELDRIIIGNARKAIQGARPTPLYRAPRWALSAGLGITFVISLAVVLIIGLHLKHQNELAARAREAFTNQLVAEAPQAAESAAVAAESPAKRLKLPAIPTQPWPPAVASYKAPAAGAASQAGADKARNRLARVEVQASRSRVEAEALEAGGGEGPAPAVSATSTGAASAEHPEAPAWMGQIEKLRSEGHTAEAEQEIRRFREAYPAYPLPHGASSTAGQAQ
jgi:hypothetical protein